MYCVRSCSVIRNRIMSETYGVGVRSFSICSFVRLSLDGGGSAIESGFFGGCG